MEEKEIKFKGNFDSVMFKANPNFKLKKDNFPDEIEALGGNSNIEIYCKDGKTYLIAAQKQEKSGNYNIYFYELPSYKKSLNPLLGHEERVMNIRYFCNQANNKDYLVTADRDRKVFIWDLETQKQVGKTINTDYESFIYSCILIFRGEKIFVVVSCVSGKQSQIFDVENGKLIDKLGSETDGDTYYLMYWLKKENEDYIVQCSKNKVSIFRVPLTKEGNLCVMGNGFLFDTGRDSPYNQGGLIYTKRDEEGNELTYLVVTSTYGEINFFQITDLRNRPAQAPFKKIKHENSHLYNVVQWNKDYLIVNNGFEENLIIIDISKDIPEIVSEVRCKEFQYERFIKKVIHPVYGEGFYSVNPFGKVKLWINKDMLIP